MLSFKYILKMFTDFLYKNYNAKICEKTICKILMKTFSSSVNSKWFASWPPNNIKAKKGWYFNVETCMMFKTFSSSFKPQFATLYDITMQTFSDIVLSKVKKSL